MARGNDAKKEVIEKIREVFGADFYGIDGANTVYIWGHEDGEKVLVKLAMTCPKTMPTFGGDSDCAFGGAPSEPVTEFKPAEITTKETDNIKNLLAKYGL